MASQKQIDANRANAQLSTGPRTPDGKAASSLNALKHGLTASLAVIPGEDTALFDQALQAFLDHLQPVGPVETVLVQQIAMASWRLTRLRALETGLFKMRLIDERRSIDRDYVNLSPHERLACVFYRECQGRDAFSTLGRYESRIERAFYRALHELQRLQAARAQPPSPSPLVSPSRSEGDQTNPIPNRPITQSPNHPITNPPVAQSPCLPVPQSPGPNSSGVPPANVRTLGKWGLCRERLPSEDACCRLFS